MTKHQQISASENIIQELFLSHYGLHLKKIDEKDGKNGKQPDFEYLVDDKRIFVCELKEYIRIDPSEETGWEVLNHSDGSVEATRNSNAPNKVSDSIHTAFKQLQKYSEPKILIFLNHYSGLDVRDLIETYRGFSEYSIANKKIIDIYYRRASEGKIKHEKDKIDLYIWIDASDKNIDLESDEFHFVVVTKSGRNIYNNYFLRKNHTESDSQ